MEVVVINGTMTSAEQEYYVRYVTDKYPRLAIKKMLLTANDDYVDVSIEPSKRIAAKMSGALISDPLTWNQAKRAEYFDTLPNSIE